MRTDNFFNYVNVKALILVMLIMSMVLLISCEDTLEWYMGLNKQPDFFDGKVYTSSMNVFGIVRPDSSAGKSLSFVHVEKTGPSNNDTNRVSWFVLPDAEVVVQHIKYGNIIAQTEFFYDSTEIDIINNEYRAEYFDVVPGEIYKMICSHETFDTVFGYTTVPHKPVVRDGSVKMKTNVLEFYIEPDPLSFLYEAVLMFPDTIIYSGYVLPDTNGTLFTVNFTDSQGLKPLVQVFSYDQNLAAYFSSITSSIINLNSYRPPFSMVEGGVGCFGSLNLTQWVVD
jgi:hypothetical protein